MLGNFDADEETIEMWLYKSVLKIPLTEHENNKEVLEKIETKCVLILKIWKRHLIIL